MMRFLLFAFLCLSFSTSAYADRFDIVAKVKRIRFHEPSQTLTSPSWQSAGWFSYERISGSAAPTTAHCRQIGGEFAVAFGPNNSQLLAMIMTAKTAGLEVKITFDSNQKHVDFCRVQYFTFQ